MRKPSVRSGFLLVEAVSALSGLFVVTFALLHLGRVAQRLLAPQELPRRYKELPAQYFQYLVNGRPRTLTLPACRAVCVDNVWILNDQTTSLYDS